MAGLSRWGEWKAHHMARLQIAHFYRTAFHPNRPEWYETQRRTTMVVFWS